MTVTLNYRNGLADKAGCMDTNIEVYSVARITNVFAQQSELWSCRSVGLDFVSSHVSGMRVRVPS